jgi:hypothetical protein
MPVKTIYGLEDMPGTVSGGNVLSLVAVRRIQMRPASS